MKLGRKANSRDGVLFAAPWLVGFVVLYAAPLFVSALISFTDWDGINPSSLRWVGLENYKTLAQDAYFLKALFNSVVYTAMNVPVQLVAALVLALLVRRARRIGVWATAYYVPHVLGGVATILIWSWFLNPQIGPINRLIGAVAGAHSRPPWLYSAEWAKPSLVFINLWQAGGPMLIFLAALMRIDPSLHEASALDGAGSWARFTRITLPLISPAILLNGLMGVVYSMQAFTAPYLLWNFQQEDSLLFYVVQMYRTAFDFDRFGAAAAMAWVLLAMLLGFTAIATFVAKGWLQSGAMQEPIS